MASDWRIIRLDRGDDGLRVDLVLLRHLRHEKAVSRNRIQKWIEAGNVLINGSAPPRPAWRMQAGDELCVRVSEIPRRERPQAQATPAGRRITVREAQRAATLVVSGGARSTV